MRVQIEVTTRCNFKCFYCVGRDMAQGDMSYHDFEHILNQHIARYGIPEEVMLQGEGEPTLHRHFFDMAAKVREVGSLPQTITNGTYEYPEHFFADFHSVGVSLDTLDEFTAERIGRFNLPKVIKFIEALAKRIRVIVHSVAISKDLPVIQKFCRERGLDHVVQPLQLKPDYAYRYPFLNLPGSERQGEFWCRFIAFRLNRFYSLDGTELPCCFIKDLSQYHGYEEMTAKAAEGITPDVCKGCLYGQRPVNS